MRPGAAATKAGFGPPFSLRAHLPFAVLAAVAAPLLAFFAAGPDLATFNDDSFSYLTIARWLAGDPRFQAAWVAQHGHFPPLFPILLAATGGAYDYAAAHLLVAAFAWIALVFLYGFAARVLASRLGGCLVVAAFLLTPTAWMGIKGVLSESTYLAVVLATLWWHAARVEARAPRVRDILVLGVGLAAAYMLRSAAVTLLAAYAVHVGVRLALRRERASALLLPYVAVAACAIAWTALRPGAGDDYWARAALIGGHWVDAPLAKLGSAGALLFGGWISSFQAGAVPGPVAKVVYALTAVVALCGTVNRARRNRLDGWYVLFTLALTLYWPFPMDTMRRLLYPVLPLLLLHAGDVLILTSRRLRVPRPAWVVAGAAALPFLLCVPALIVGARKALDREPVAGTPYAYADMADYYRFVEPDKARKEASLHIALFGGLRAIDAATPPGARIMWVRPEYVALLSHRDVVPYLYAWDPLTLAREIRRTGTTHVISATLYKIDVRGQLGEPWVTLRPVWSFADPVLEITNPVSNESQFILLKIDPERLERFIAERSRTGER